MHPNATLLRRLYTGLDSHDHTTMAACYDDGATFEDIAFRLKGKKAIHAMWHMICSPESDLKATFEVVEADDAHGVVKLVDRYTFSATDLPVTNVIESRFTFRNGKIVEHHDDCDPEAWAEMAFGKRLGILPGRFRLVRSGLARMKLWKFRRQHPEYS